MHVRKWLIAVNGAVANPLDADAFALRFNAVLTLTGDAPASVWPADTLKLGLARWKFAPSTAEVSALIEQRGAPIRRQVKALRKVTDAELGRPKAPPAPREAPTEEALRAVAEMTAQLKSHLAEHRHANIPEGKLRPTPRCCMTTRPPCAIRTSRLRSAAWQRSGRRRCGNALACRPWPDDDGILRVTEGWRPAGPPPHIDPLQRSP